MANRPLPPDPAGGQCCDWGYCSGPSNGWRWHNEHGWLPVCDNHTGGPKAAKAGVYVADCRECDMCGGCETHEGCTTDLRHLDWFMQFASPGETPCGQPYTRHGTPYICAKPAGHGGEWHMARTGDGWPNTPAHSALDQPQEPTEDNDE